MLEGHQNSPKNYMWQEWNQEVFSTKGKVEMSLRTDMHSSPLDFSIGWVQEGVRLLNTTYISDKYQQYCPTKTPSVLRIAWKLLDGSERAPAGCMVNIQKRHIWRHSSRNWIVLYCLLWEVPLLLLCNRHPFTIRRWVVQDLGYSQ